MRVITLSALSLILLAPFANAQIAPHTATVETMDDPGANWFITKTDNGAYRIRDKDERVMRPVNDFADRTTLFDAVPAFPTTVLNCATGGKPQKFTGDGG